MNIEKQNKDFIESGNDYIEIPALIRILLFFFSFMFVFISCDNNILEQSDHTILFRSIFYKGLIHERLFNVFDYTIIILSFFMIFRYGFNFVNGARVLKVIFWAVIINFIFLMVNPNNAAKYMILGFPLISDVSQFTNMFFMFAIFFLKDKEIRNEVLYLIIKYILFFLTIKMTFLFFLWIQGKGNYSLFGLHSILIEEDTLLFVAFTQMLLLCLYLLSKKKFFLVLWILQVIFQIISFRRSGMFLTFLAAIMIYTFYNLKNSSIQKKYVFIVMVIVVSYLIMNTIQFLPYKYGMFIARYIGEYVDIPGVPYHETFKNLHIEQANWGLFEALGNLGIWGYGYGTGRGDIIPLLTFGNTGLHNAYISIWMNQSIFNMFYYLFLFFLIIKYTSFHLWEKVKESHIYFIRAVFLIYLMLFFINAWVLPTGNFTEGKMGITRTLLFVFALGLSDKDLGNVFKRLLK